MVPLPRFHKLDDAKKTLLLKTAMAEFAERGFEGASLNKIIAASSISKGAFYYYFADKLDLFVAVLRHFFDVRDAFDWTGVLAAKGHDAYWDAFLNSSKELLVSMLGRPEMLGLGQALAELPTSVLEQPEGELAEYMQDAMALTSEIILHGQAIGAVRDDMPLELLMMLWRVNDEALGRYFLAHWPGLDDEGRDRLTDMIFDTFRRLLAP